jgi:transglutaminase-like putative cysteine protease
MKDSIRKLASFILLIVSLTLLISFLNSLNFSKTGFEGFIGEGLYRGEEDSGVETYEYYSTLGYDQGIAGVPSGNASSSEFSGFSGSFSNMNEPFNPPQVPLFFVEGLDNQTNYLRLYTASNYRDGRWIEDEVPCSKASGFAVRQYKVTPIVNLTSYLPVAKDTVALIPQIYECYNPDANTYSVTSTKTSYVGLSSAEPVKPGKFAERWDAIMNDRIKELAEKITAQATNDYERVVLIESFLEKNYINEYVEPKGEPIEHFLFVSKKGTCREFASAFVVLARSLGIPARVVFGYLANPTPENQTIFASDAYVWAEVKFESGWIEFDPTPRGKGIETETKITFVDEIIVAGKNFSISGNVNDENKKPVSGFVEIFLKKNKKDRNEKGLLVGILPVIDGEFAGKLKAPEITGEYNVIAHYTGSLAYSESWSDPKVRIYEEPEIEVVLPKRVPVEFNLTGRITASKPYSGYVYVWIDGKKDKVEVENGEFQISLRLQPGMHTFKLNFTGEGYILPAELEREFEAGIVDVQLNDTVEYGKELEGRFTFNGKPIENTTLVVEGVETKTDENGNFSLNIPLTLGKNEISIEVPEMGYKAVRTVYSKKHVNLDHKFQNGEIVIFVHDNGKPVDGKIEAFGVERELKGGVATFKLPEDFESDVVRYKGSDKYFPTEKRVVKEFPYHLLAIPILLGVALFSAYYFYRTKSEKKFLAIVIKKEHPDLPNVWSPGETIEIEIFNHHEGKIVAKVDNRIFEGEKELNLHLKFREKGVKLLTVERVVGGSVKERKKIELKIAPYREGIVEVFCMLSRDAENNGLSVREKTAREIMNLLELQSPKLLRYFELSKYRRDNFSRNEFVDAFMEYMRLRGIDD